MSTVTDNCLSELEQEQKSSGAREFAAAGMTLYVQFERTGVLSDLENAIGNIERALSLTPDGHADKPMFFNALGMLFEVQFGHTGTLSDLERAVRNNQQAVCLTPDDHPDVPMYLSSLGKSFQSRFEHTGTLADLEEAIKARQQVVSLTPGDHPDKPGRLNNLGISFQSRFRRTGMLSDIEDAIEIQQQAVSLTPDHHPDKPWRLNNLGCAFQSRFWHIGTLSDLEEVIKNRQQALSLTPDDHVDKPMYFNNLGIAFESRFERTGILSDLEKATANQKQAVTLTPDNHPDKPGRLSNLGISFQHRFERTGMLSDLEEAIKTKQQAVSLTPDDHPDKAMYYNNLGISFESRFERAGMLSDIEEAIKNQQQAVSLTPNDHTNKRVFLNNLGVSFERRFDRTGMLSDLEEAIKSKHHAMSLTPDDHPDKPMCLNNLGISFQNRFERTGMLSDLQEAIKNEQMAVSLTPDDHPDKSGRLNNLGISFRTRFERTGMLSDIQDAITNQQQSVSLTPNDHPNKQALLSNLGISFESRFGRTGILSDLENAIRNKQQAVSLAPDDHPDKPIYLNNLGNSFESRFGCTRMLSDLEDAIKNKQEALLLIPDGHAGKPICLHNLGISSECRFQHTGSLDDLCNAVSNFKLAATSNIGPVLLRCHVSQRWARLEAQRNSPSALVAYRQAINLLPQVAWIGDPIATRHSQLTDLSDLPREAAAFALDVGHPNLALEWLEQGRSVVWNQLLHLRTPVDHLHQAQPDLCAEFIRLSHELQTAATRGHNPNSSGHIKNPISLEEETQRHHRLAEEWDMLVEKIRSLPGFQGFLLPEKVSALMNAASSGPVVVINVHERRCDALVLVQGRDQVFHIPLEKLHYDDLKRMHKSLRHYLANPHRAQRWDHRTGGPLPMGGPRMAGILKQIYTNIVYPILQGLDMTTIRPKPLNLPRIWWCPTGLLTFFPLHAACYRIGPRIDGTFDYVVSSCIPTVNALLEARAPKQQPFSHLAGIAMTHTPGQSSLPGVETEFMAMKKLLNSDSRWSFEILRNDQATREQVLTCMKSSNWIHLACHAVQDKQEPTCSGFRLHDRRLTIMDIIGKQFSHTDFAFLSACQTATGDEKASDEVVHITGAMLGAGYRNVIGTMWAIPDEAAPRIAAKVYEVLLSGGEPDSDRAAQALHEAVREVRESSHDSYTCWVPFVRYGA